MGGSVIERHGHHVDDNGFIHHHDVPMGWDEADKRAGRRLDRRRAWAFIDGELCSVVRWTGKCSGCSDDDPYSGRGFGCDECGYHGVVRMAEWVPDMGGAG